MVTCRKCGVARPEADYYVTRTDCKPCVRAAASAYRAANLEKVRAYDRERGLRPDRKAAVRARYPRYKNKHYRKVTAKQRHAHIVVGNAIHAGKLIPQPCERCGYGVGIHAHHEDYSKPLEVVWLCTTHHGERHREINEERRRAAA